MPDRPRGRSAFSNGLWAAVLAGLVSALGAILSLLLVLVLPVEDFGIYSYATALVAIGMSVAQGGLASLAVKLLVSDQNRARSTLALIMATRTTFALLGYLLIVCISFSSSTFPTVAATIIAGLALFARSGNGADFWYQAQMRNGVPSAIRITVALTSFAFRLVALWLWPNVWVFLALFVGEAVVGTVAVWVRYLTDPSAPGMGRPRADEAVALAKSSTPLMLSGLANQINLRGDIVLLQALSGAGAVGVYSVAARLSDLAQVLPTAFMSATLPVLVKAREEFGPNHPRYLEMLQRSYDIAFWLGIFLALVVGAVGTAVIHLLLDAKFAPAVPVLWIQLATSPFVFMALVYSKWIIAEGKLWLSLIRHGVGAVINIGLNLLLIPTFGLQGAAMSTLTSYIVASYLSCFLTSESRLAGRQMSLAFVAPARFLIRRLKPRDTE